MEQEAERLTRYKNEYHPDSVTQKSQSAWIRIDSRAGKNLGF